MLSSNGNYSKFWLSITVTREENGEEGRIYFSLHRNVRFMLVFIIISAIRKKYLKTRSGYAIWESLLHSTFQISVPRSWDLAAWRALTECYQNCSKMLLPNLQLLQVLTNLKNVSFVKSKKQFPV